MKKWRFDSYCVTQLNIKKIWSNVWQMIYSKNTEGRA